MSEMPDENAQEFRRVVFPILKDRYGQDFEKLVGLCRKVRNSEAKAKKMTADDQVDFLCELDEAIGGYKKRIDDRVYFERMAQAQEDLRKTAELLGGAVPSLGELDGMHWGLIAEELDVIAPEWIKKELSSRNMMELLILLKKASVLSACLSVGLLLAGGRDIEDVQSRDQRKIRLPYLFATMALLRFWKKWTGEDPAYAKATPEKDQVSGGPLEQASTEFVRVALTHLDPTVTAANAVTSVNNARERLRQIHEELAQLSDDRAAPPSVLKNELR